MLRGRIRKLCLENLHINCMAENAEESDTPNSVRFAVLHKEEKIEEIKTYIYSVLPDANIELVLPKVKNPVLSKLKCNLEGRYTL